MYVGPGGPGPWVSVFNNSREIRQRNLDQNQEPKQLNKDGTLQEKTPPSLEKPSQMDPNTQEIMQFYQLLQNLRRVNIEKLDPMEREKLKALSEQYKYHLQQY